jgi:sugar lactone lactonase YvrE
MCAFVYVCACASLRRPRVCFLVGKNNASLFTPSPHNDLRCHTQVRRIRKIDLATRHVTTFVGSVFGANNGIGTMAGFLIPNGLSIDLDGNLWVADWMMIRRVTPGGVVTTPLGSTLPGCSEGRGTNARFQQLYGMALDHSGNLWAAEGFSDLVTFFELRIYPSPCTGVRSS